MTIWRVDYQGLMVFQHYGMVGKVELKGQGTVQDPCRFSWSVAWTTGSGQPFSFGEEKNLHTACQKVEHSFDPKNITTQTAQLIQKIAAENFLTDNDLIVADRKMESVAGHIQVEDYLEIDRINCRHKDEDSCECICHQHKGIIIHDRACCNPCMGCGFREVMRT